MGNGWRPIASGGDVRNLCRVLVSSEAGSPGPGRPGNKGMVNPTKVNIETSGSHPATCRSGSREFRGRDSKDTGYGKAPA